MFFHTGAHSIPRDHTDGVSDSMTSSWPAEFVVLVDGRHAWQQHSKSVTHSVLDTFQQTIFPHGAVNTGNPDWRMPKPCGPLMERMFVYADCHLNRYRGESDLLRFSATVAWVSMVLGERVGFLAHTGDTSAYLVHRRTGAMRRLTPEQPEFLRVNAPGRIEHNHILPTRIPIHLPAQHILVIVTNEMNTLVNEDELRRHVSNATSPQQLAEALTAFAKRRAPPDHNDLTVVACGIGP
jgi:serine/threonine protein phosphatase PrpC